MSETLEQYMERMAKLKTEYEKSLESLPLLHCDGCDKETRHKEYVQVKHGAATVYDQCVVCENLTRRPEGLQPVSQGQVAEMRQRVYAEEKKVRDE